MIGERFAWGHLEKTGGDATLELFEQVPELVRFADPVDSQHKHCHFEDRESEIQGKLLALNIRRLPAWILSRAQHTARFGTYPDYEPWFMVSPLEMAQSTDPDRRLAQFTSDGRFSVGRWLRAEFLAGDFVAFVSEFTDVPEERRAAIAEVARVHGGATEAYDHEVDHWFTPEQLRLMYERNPVWAALEREGYGTLAA